MLDADLACAAARINQPGYTPVPPLHIYCWTDRRFAQRAAADDRVLEAGVREKADHGAIAIAVGAARGPASLSDQRERYASR